LKGNYEYSFDLFYIFLKNFSNRLKALGQRINASKEDGFYLMATISRVS